MFQGFTPQGAGLSPIAQGATIYIFDQKNLSVSTASVTGVSQPHLSKAAQGNPMAAYQGFVVDLTLSSGSDTTTIEFPVNSAMATYPDKGWFVCTDPMLVSREAERIGNEAKQRLAQRSNDERIVAACDRIVMQVHPERQKAAQQEEEMAQMRNQLSAITGRLDQFISMLSAAQGPRNNKAKEEQ